MLHVAENPGPKMAYDALPTGKPLPTKENGVPPLVSSKGAERVVMSDDPAPPVPFTAITTTTTEDTAVSPPGSVAVRVKPMTFLANTEFGEEGG